MRVHVAGRDFELEGDAADPYFRSATGEAAGLASLAAWARAHLPPDAVVIDAGGNIGLTALLFAAVAPLGHVHVFEALAANAALLRRNLALNGITNCTVNAVALGRQAGTARMAGTGAGAFVVPDTGGDVPVTTLDAYCAAFGRVDFVKMDVEGAEPAVLAGAAGAIERFRPPVFLEFNSWCLGFHQGYSARDFAFRLWRAFDAWALDGAGAEVAAGEAVAFLHDNAVLHGAVSDVLLRLKAGARVPDLADPAYAPVDGAAAGRLAAAEAGLLAVHRSTSWRVTAPLRAVGRLLRGGIAGRRQS